MHEERHVNLAPLEHRAARPDQGTDELRRPADVAAEIRVRSASMPSRITACRSELASIPACARSAAVSCWRAISRARRIGRSSQRRQAARASRRQRRRHPRLATVSTAVFETIDAELRRGADHAAPIASCASRWASTLACTSPGTCLHVLGSSSPFPWVPPCRPRVRSLEVASSRARYIYI